MHLFMAYIGGYTETSNIELHDMRFVVGNTIEDYFPQLIAQWWGDRKQLHLDAWGAINSADGYAVSLQKTPATHVEKLYFINLGGYDPHQFTELHKNALIVAQNNKDAKAKAKAQIQNWGMPHRDNLFEIEKMLQLTQIEGHYIHLTKTNTSTPFTFTCAYKKI